MPFAIKERLSSAHVLAIIAVVLALGGNALAFHLGKNSVGAEAVLKKSASWMGSPSAPNPDTPPTPYRIRPNGPSD